MTLHLCCENRKKNDQSEYYFAKTAAFVCVCVFACVCVQYGILKKNMEIHFIERLLFFLKITKLTIILQ